jgi:hypothetical protein
LPVAWEETARPARLVIDHPDRGDAAMNASPIILQEIARQRQQALLREAYNDHVASLVRGERHSRTKNLVNALSTAFAAKMRAKERSAGAVTAPAL